MKSAIGSMRRVDKLRYISPRTTHSSTRIECTATEKNKMPQGKNKELQ